MIIRHNIASLNTNNRLTQNKKKADSVLEKLSSGYKINRAGDDAAGLAISEKMRGQIRGLNMAGKNIQDGISLIETAESGLGSIQDPNLLRLRELAIQAANDTLTDFDRQQIQQEVEQIKSGIDAIANNTEFNGIKLLNNSSSEIKSGTTESNIIWKTIQTGAHGNFKSIIASSDKLIAVSSEGEIAMSTDGENWTVTNLPSPVSLHDAYWDGNKFFAVGGRQTVIYSTDGVNWDYGITGGSHYFYSINEKNGIYMASGNAGIAYSNDGTTWTYQDPNLNQATSEISKNNNEFIWLKGINFIRTSTDGVNWTDKPRLPTHINSISWNGSIHVAVGANGAIITSSDLSNWDSQISNTSNNINEVVFDGSKFVATAEDTVLYSYNGTDWKSSTTTPGMIIDTVSFNDQFISVGDKGKIFVGAKDNDSSQFENSNNKEIQLQVGANSNQNMRIELSDVRASALGLDKIDLSTQKGANDTISIIDKAIAIASKERSKYGAYQNRLEHANQSVMNTSENLQSAESRIRDTDIAKEIMIFTKNNILLQATQSMLAQSNKQPEGILQLLQ